MRFPITIIIGNVYKMSVNIIICAFIDLLPIALKMQWPQIINFG